jgi:hypothetical protein
VTHKIKKQMDAEALAFDDIYEHLAGFAIIYTKRGYVNAEEHQVVYLVETVSHLTNEGRWLVKYKGEVSYVSPSLFTMLKQNTHSMVLGQTLKDGTLMTREKAYDMSRVNAFGTCTKVQQKQQQFSSTVGLNLTAQPATTSVSACNTTPTTTSNNALMDGVEGLTPTGRKKRGRKPAMKDAFVTATRGANHKEVKKRTNTVQRVTRINLKRKRKDEEEGGDDDARLTMDMNNRRLLHQLNDGPPPLAPALTEKERGQQAKDETQLTANYNAVEVEFIV